MGDYKLPMIKKKIFFPSQLFLAARKTFAGLIKYTVTYFQIRYRF